MHSLVAIFFCLLQVSSLFVSGTSFIGKDFIDSINEKAITWKAKENFAGYSEARLRKLTGLLDDYEQLSLLPTKTYNAKEEDFPVDFDSRTKWFNCSSIGEIVDQGDCGSCWAVSSASVMSDRMCIHKNENVHVSSLDILSCCPFCGNGCGGGYPLRAFEYWNRTGVVSGGNYDSGLGCRPYSIPNTGYNPNERILPTPKCNQTCEAGYAKNYTDDKTFGQIAYRVRGVADIQKEIMTNGPVVACFTVYSDFYAYDSGVYQHVSGRYMGGHAVRMIGWGVENGTNYWLISNSWNYSFGQNGTFKILRGSDHLGIEERISAGVPM